MSTQAALRSRIAALKLSPQGEAWVTQALYPPGDLTRVAIPTRTHYPTLRVEYRPSVVLTAPPTLPDGSTWDLLLFSPPTDSTALIWATAASGNPAVFDTATAPAGAQSGFLSTVPNLTGLTRPYAILTRNAAGAASASSAYQSIASPIRHLGFRITSKSYTAHMTASDLYNGGSVTTAQYDANYSAAAGFSLLGGRPSVESITTVPLTEDEMTSSSPFAVVSEAKDGIFVPHRLMGPTFEFVRPFESITRSCSLENGNTYQIIHAAGAVASSTLIGSHPVFVNAAGSTAAGFYPWWVEHTYLTAARPDDMGYDAVTTAVSIFRGLHKQATITVALHVSMECILQVDSPFRTLAGDPDEPDPRALSAYFEIAARMPHAYPASYNSLGLVLPAIARAIKFALPYVPRLVAGAAAAAPIIKEIVSVARGPPSAKAAQPRVVVTERVRAPVVEPPVVVRPAPKPRRVARPAQVKWALKMNRGATGPRANAKRKRPRR